MYKRVSDGFWALSTGTLLLLSLAMFGCTTTDDDSNTQADKTKPTAVDVVSLTPVIGAGSKLDVTWTQSSDNSSAPNQLVYHIYYSDTGGETYVEGDSVVGQTQATLKYLAPGRNYQVFVSAEDEAGNLGPSGATKSAATNAALTFDGDIADIIALDCATSECHGANNPTGGVQLNASKTESVYLSLTSASCAPNLQPLVDTTTDPNNILANSYLDDLLDPAKRANSACSSPMPPAPSKPALSAAKYQVIENWLVAGAIEK